MNVILVDDEAVAVNALRRRVNWQRFGVEEVYIANSMRQAQELFSAKEIHVMLCDIEMPQGNGLDLFEWVKSHYPAVECVFVTCHADYDYMRKAMQLGSADYILKPIEYEELEGILGKVAQRVQKRAERDTGSQTGDQEVRIPAHVLQKLAAEEKGSPGESAVSAVTDYIHRHLHEQISISKLAEQVYLNEQYMARLFKKSVGLSILEYVTRERLKLARELLLSTDYPINRVADSVGYDNYSYFARLFKRETGMTPQEYRQRGGKSDEKPATL